MIFFFFSFEEIFVAEYVLLSRMFCVDHEIAIMNCEICLVE